MLDSVCTTIMGQSPPSTTYNEVGHGAPFFQGKAEFTDLFPVATKWCTSPSKMANANDILLSVRAPVGPTNLAPADCCIGRGLAAIRPEGRVETRYVLYTLRAFGSALREKATGTTFEAVSGDDVRGFVFPLAPLAEQRRIVAAIEEQFTRLDAGVAALRRVQAALKRYRAAVLKAAVEGKLTEAWRAQHPDVEPASALLARILAERRARWEAELRAKGKDPVKACYPEPVLPDTSNLPELPPDWCWASLDQIAVLKRGRFSIRPRNDPRYYDGVYPFLQIGDLPSEGGEIRTYRQTLNDAGLEVSRLFPAGTVLISIAASIGATGILSFPSCFPDSLVGAMCYSDTTAWYVELALRTRRRDLENSSYASGGQPNISLPVLQALAIPFPPLAEQERIVGEVEQRLSVVSELRTALLANLKRAERLRQSILQRAFAGQLVPQDPTDEPASVLLERVRSERQAQADDTSHARNGRGQRGRQPSKTRAAVGREEDANGHPELVGEAVSGMRQNPLWEAEAVASGVRPTAAGEGEEG